MLVRRCEIKELNDKVEGRLVFATNLSHYGASFERKNLFAIIAEEIKNVKSSHRRLGNGYYVGFDECLQSVLKLFEED